ncbi:MAG: damage-inducible protein DinB [Rhodobacteraceae bacterium]|nr:damage-inducible protein DinB [Paracoccaceae bacterium]
MGQTHNLVSPEWCLVMARYNRWQNRAMIAAAGTLDDAARRAPRGAFWGSIQGTFSHLLWADHVWMSRLDGWEAPHADLPGSAGFVADWADLRSKRQITDARISRWAQGLRADALGGDLCWMSGAAGREVTLPRAVCVMQMVNHQTHHRGQIHAMLTGAGVDPGPTDLFLMPELLG